MSDETCRLPRAFSWLNATQFLGAMNDNILKLLIVFFLISLRGPQQAGTIAATAGAVFVLPFLLFSAASGVLADRMSKRRIIIAVKGLEVLIAALGVVSFLADSATGLYVVLFCMATQSALFGPSKYGIVPELVKKNQLSKANSLLETLTYLAIILGTAAAPLLVQLSGGRYHLAACAGILIAVIGLGVSLRIPPTPPAGSQKELSINFLKEIGQTLSHVRRDGHLMLAVLGSAYFLFLGAFAQINLIPFGMKHLGLSQEQSGYLFLVAALGIGAGAFLAGRLSGRNVEFGVVPLGAFGLAAATLGLSAVPERLALVLPLIGLLGISAGLFLVPLHAFIQLRARREVLGEVLAASAFLSWTGVLLASGLAWLLSGPLEATPATGFLVLGLFTLVLTIVTLIVLPDFLLRFIALLVMRLLYRLRINGEENIPFEGPALLVANHVSWVDALLLLATQQRRIRFVMHRTIYNQPLLRPLFRLMQVIPVASGDSRAAMKEFISSTRGALEEGYLVCIFAEGAITRSGMMQEFKQGLELVMRGVDCPIVPVYIGGAWGSILSYAHGRPLSRLPLSLPYPVSILFGKAMPACSKAFEVKQAVMELACADFEAKKAMGRNLAAELIASARRNWTRKALADSTGRQLSFGETLAGALALAERLRPKVAAQSFVGILLPPSVGGALANLAVTLLGKVPVNLNYTASPEGFTSAIAQCDIETVITSSAFLEKIDHLPPLDGVLFLEEILQQMTAPVKRRAWLRARFLPTRQLLHKGAQADDLATVLFSSGSTGEPKGVMLSHHNILSNLEAIRTVAAIKAEDNVCSALPFFHALGFTATLWLPLLSGFSAVYHVNPMDGAKIAMLARRHRSTLLLATPTFLQAYIRRAKPEDFATLRLVITGAEKLRSRIADSFEAKFGLRPLEGYGATELSPLVSMNIPEVRVGRTRQQGAKEGSVGHPIPGVVIRVVDPDSGAPLSPGEPGLVLAKGPNLMRGYLGKEEKTAEAIRDGWYVTGDIGHLDRQGFLTISDRLARFSKIGGEMVPHLAVEEALYAGLTSGAQVLAVTTLPDEKKGERLIVLHTAEAGTAEHLQAIMDAADLPNLWKPGRDAYLKVESLPLLGSGKLDLKGLKELARTSFDKAGRENLHSAKA